MAEALAVPLESIFNTLTNVANKLKENKNTQNLHSALGSLKNCVEQLAHIVQNEQNQRTSQETTIREHEDEIDNLKQSNMKGHIIITSKEQFGVCHIKSDDQLQQENKSLAQHVKDLAKKKYNQDITEDDIKACFRLKKGGILVKFWKKGRGSQFHTLSSNIKSTKGSDINLFFNFMLTSRRGELLFQIRKLKKEKKIAKFYSDEFGGISIKFSNGDKKIKITDVVKEGSKLKTWTLDELLAACS